MTWEGIVPCKRRKSFERFLHHDDARIRALAEEMREKDLAARRLLREEAELDDMSAEKGLQAGTWCNEETEPECSDGVWSAELPS